MFNNKKNLTLYLIGTTMIIAGLFVGCTLPTTEGNIKPSTEVNETPTEEVILVDDSENAPSDAVIESVQPNVPLVSNIFTADPSAHVFEGKIYIYPSHDPDYLDPNASSHEGGQYMMEDYHVLSIESFDSPAVDEGEVLHLKDVPWASQQLWAPDAAYKNNLYYLYFPAKDQEGIFRIGVATSTSPAGPFTAEPTFIPGSMSIDPAIYVDTDDQAYLFYGGIWGGQLERWQTGEYIANASEPGPNEPALGPMMAVMSDDMLTFASEPMEIEINDKEGNPILAGDESRRFFEAPWIHQYDGTYYLSYSTGSTHLIVYATSEQIEGPYTYQGTILKPVLGWTNHHSIVEFEDQWYLFYHDASLSEGVDYKRSVKYTLLEYNDDGSIKTITP